MIQLVSILLALNEEIVGIIAKFFGRLVTVAFGLSMPPSCPPESRQGFYTINLEYINQQVF